MVEIGLYGIKLNNGHPRVLRARLIRKIEFKGSNVVKGRQLEGLRKIGQTSDYFRGRNFDAYDEVFLLDVMSNVFGLQNGASQAKRLVENCNVPLTFGGGLRNLDDVKRVMDIGVERLAINSALHENLSLIDEIANLYGSQAVLAHVEARVIDGQRYALFDSGREIGLGLITWLRRLAERPVGEILVTSIERDGMNAGPDTELLERVDEMGFPRFLYSGGISSFEQVNRVFRDYQCVRGVAIGRFLHEEEGSSI